MSVKKAVALISGGLDSLLAAKVVMEQGVHVEGLNFYSGFFGVGCSCVTCRHKQGKAVYNSAVWIAEKLGIKLHVLDVVQDFQKVLLNPRYGYGANLNPCLDCKVFIVTKALEWIKAHDFDFIVTGEVVGQRPMSQLKHMLPIVAKRSEADDLLLRPLSAKLLEPTKPEREGWVDRDRLLGFNGRGRKPQIALARSFGFEHFPQPAGGCLLTEKGFCARLSDLWVARGQAVYERDDIDLLKVGRHIRPRPHFKLIVGREDAENEFLARFTDKMMSLSCVGFQGPLVLIDGKDLTQEDLELAAKMTARFGKGKYEDQVKVSIYFPDKQKIMQVTVSMDLDEALLQTWYV